MRSLFPSLLLLCAVGAIAQQSNPLRRAVEPDTWPTWALVIVGIGGIVYAARTLAAIRHEAHIAKDIAAAARQNAEAVIDSERAWVVAETPRISEIASGRPVRIFWTIKNGGKTTARVREKAETFSVNPNAEILAEQPNYPHSTTWPDGAVLAPDATLSCVVYVANIDPWQYIENGSMVLFVFGFVKYVDVFNREHETRYIFRFDTSDPQLRGFHVDGRREYSKAT